MKSKYWAALLSLLLLISAGVGAWLLLGQGEAVAAEIWSEGKLVKTLPLAADQSLTVETAEGRNIITVRDGAIAVTEADCPDHYCMQRGFCSGGAQIVCLPNRLVIKFVGETEFDGVSG